MSHLGRNAAADGGSRRQRRRGGQPSLCRIMFVMSTMSMTRASFIFHDVFLVLSMMSVECIHVLDVHGVPNNGVVMNKL